MSGEQTRMVRFQERIGDEDQQRADLYGVLATLFAEPPNADLLLALRVQSDATQAGATPLELAWKGLCDAADPSKVQALQDEYAACFMGIGKPAVFLYISYYASGFLHEKPLAKIRQDLAQLGLSRKEGVSETEDHISCLCEVQAKVLSRLKRNFSKPIWPLGLSRCAMRFRRCKKRSFIRMWAICYGLFYQ
jgi:TorA maturation chaperone TorD